MCVCAFVVFSMCFAIMVLHQRYRESQNRLFVVVFFWCFHFFFLHSLAIANVTLCKATYECTKTHWRACTQFESDRKKSEMSERDKVYIYDLGVVWPPLFSNKKTLFFLFFLHQKNTDRNHTRAMTTSVQVEEEEDGKTSKINNEILISRRYHTERIKTLKDRNASSAKKNIIKIRAHWQWQDSVDCRLHPTRNQTERKEEEEEDQNTYKKHHNRKCLSTNGVLENVSKTKSDKKSTIDIHEILYRATTTTSTGQYLNGLRFCLLFFSLQIFFYAPSSTKEYDSFRA